MQAYLRKWNLISSYSTAVASLNFFSVLLILTLLYAFSRVVSLPLPGGYSGYLPALIILAGWVFHLIFMGLGTRIGIPALLPDLRRINQVVRNYKKDWVVVKFDDVKKAFPVLPALEKLPLYNLVSFSIWSVIALAVVVYFLWTWQVPLHLILQFSVVFLTGLLAGGITVLAWSENLTNSVRILYKQFLHTSHVDFKHRATSSLWIKFSLILIQLSVTTGMFFLPFGGVENIWHAVMVGVMLFYLVFLILVVFINIVKALQEVHKSALKIEAGEGVYHYPGILDRELLEVSQSFIGMSKGLVDYRNNLENKVDERTLALTTLNTLLSERDKRNKEELKLAAEIQKGILPPLPASWNGLSIAGWGHSLETVSGDYYDIFHTPGNRLGILLADVSGHGVPAGLISTMAKVAFSRAAFESTHPSVILTEVNRSLERSITTHDYLSAFLITVDEMHRFRYGNAAHHPALLYRYKTRKVMQLDAAGQFIGIFPEEENNYEEREAFLEPGDKLLIYTDGLVEQLNAKDHRLGLQAIIDLLDQSHKDSAEETVSRIVRFFDRFRKNIPIGDDVTLLVIESTPSFNRMRIFLAKARELIREQKKLKALEVLEQALKADSTSKDALRLAGILSDNIGRFDQAVEIFQNYLQHYNRDAEIYNRLAIVEIKRGSYHEAMLSARNAVHYRPDYAEAWNHLGISLSHLGDFDEALASFEKAFQLDPDNEIYKNSLEKIKQRREERK